MDYGARPLRSTRRLQNIQTSLPKWYSISNSAAAGLPTQISIYDEIGMFGVPAGEFMADLKAINGDIELHINSPGGDVHDGLAIYNQLKQRAGSIAVVVDGLAASAASFIAQAASPGRLQMAPHSQMMVHNGFSMAIGDASDLRKTADLLDMITTEIASIYAERSGKPVESWLAAMSAETWYTDKAAVEAGLADSILGQEPAPAASWDLSVYGHHVASGQPGYANAVIINADGNHAPMSGTHNHTHSAYGSQGGDQLHSHMHSHDNDAAHGHSHAEAATDKAVPAVRNADGPADLGDGWVQDPDGTVRFDPDGDGDDDSTPEGDTDHDYFAADGSQLQDVPPCPEGAQNAASTDDDDDAKKPFPGAAAPFKKKAADLAGMFPVLAADVDNSPWDASKAWAAGAASDDPAAFYKGICAGRKAGDPKTQAAWALPYKYSPSSPPNAAGVKNALARLPQTQGLTNADEAKATLQKAMKQVNPDYDPDALLDPAVIASAFTVPEPEADRGEWDAGTVLRAALASADPAWYFRSVCAGRLPGDPATQAAWALPYRRTPSSPPNARAVAAALAELPRVASLANRDEARGVLNRAMRSINPAYEPDDEIDPDLLSAAFTVALG